MRCSDGETENQNLVSENPSSSSRSSNAGAWRRKSSVLLGGAEAHHVFDAGPGVPGPVEQGDLAAGGQPGDVALEVPLPALRSRSASPARRRWPRAG